MMAPGICELFTIIDQLEEKLTDVTTRFNTSEKERVRLLRTNRLLEEQLKGYIYGNSKEKEVIDCGNAEDK